MRATTFILFLLGDVKKIGCLQRQRINEDENQYDSLMGAEGDRMYLLKQLDRERNEMDISNSILEFCIVIRYRNTK